jgi:alkylation response protein AidB-like acyl-CoA dehydrogenase
MTVVRDHPVPAADAVAGLRDAAAAHRDYGERHGTLHPAVWRALEDSALPQAALPACCGGLEWPPPQILDAVRQVAFADPAAGWVAAICGPAGAFLSRLDPGIACELAGNRTLIAGSSLPAGVTEPAGAAVRLKGRWPLVSGAPAMTLAALAAPAAGPDGTAAVRWWLVPRRDVTVAEDWDAIGLRGSASVTVSCSTLVPAAHSIRLADAPAIDVPLFRYPLYGLMAGCIAAVADATAARALAAFTRMAATTRTRHAAGTLAGQPHAQAAYARADGLVQAARALLDGATAAAWASARDGEVSAGQRALLRLACCQIADAAEAACRILFDAAGSAAVHYGNGLEGCWRDAVAISRHALVAGRGRQLVGAHHLAAHAAEDL